MADEIVNLPEVAEVPVTEPELEPVPNPTKREAKSPWLTRFRYKPGQSGNLAGRSKKPPVTTAMESFANRPYPPNQRKALETMTGMKLRNDFTCAEAIALGQMLKAVGNTEAAKAVMDRIDGAITQALELSGAGGAPLMAPIIVTQYVSVNREDGKVVKVVEAEDPNGDSQRDSQPDPAPD